MKGFPNKHLTVGGNDPLLPTLLDAINHATEIRITTAFIKVTGILLIKDALEDALDRGASIRILTGDYLGVTDPEALRHILLLQEMGAEARVFESGGLHSFHMKAYLFTHTADHRESEGCAFVGSSNLSRSALQHGLEWNLMINQAEDEARFRLILEEYEAIYQDSRCKPLTQSWISEYQSRRPDQNIPAQLIPDGMERLDPPEPNEIQTEALDALSKTRDEGYQRGLVVMATGLGKTWLAAFDCHQMNARRVLFVAHREEILNQAEETYLRIRPEMSVGRYDGNNRDGDAEMLFASVQTLGKANVLETFARTHFDYIVVDEFHHAAARTYQRLLNHFRPRFMLGLTATPERTDQSDILALCDDNLVFGKDLFSGIKANLLCPFHYHGVADTVNYQEISWRNGKFDETELFNQLATQARARHNLTNWRKLRQSRTLAFCISTRHADFMADYFTRHGVKAVSVHSRSTVRRNEALAQLEDGKVDVIFSVDLFNEGVDLPAIDTVLMLRPTESKIIFLQQLGRGLRISEAKEKLVVLDFIGNHISFFRKAEALFRVGVTNSDRKKFINQVENHGLPLPDGCFVNYDLESIDFMRQLVATRVDQQLATYRALRESYGRRPVLAEFYQAGGAVETIRREHGQWFAFVQQEEDLTDDENSCLEVYSEFFAELETTTLTKSYKLVALEALVELEGFRSPPVSEVLAQQSYEVMQRRRALLVDLPPEFQELKLESEESMRKWTKYWLKNPINAWVGGNKGSQLSWFSLLEGKLVFKGEVQDSLYDTFVTSVKELVDYRFRQYEARLAERVLPNDDNVVPLQTGDRQEVPFFTDLRIACGHFRSSHHDDENILYQSVPSTLGKLDPAKHFIARASGNSMNGGRHPIKHGDHLLLELITPNNAGSNDGHIIAIEQQDAGGDDQYLLRKVKKCGTGQYELIAQNADYPAIMAAADMHTFARFKQVVDPADLYLHQEFMREEIPGLFDLEFNTGLWNVGHVCPKERSEQFLLVTLNKQGKSVDHQYHDYFKAADLLHWQSQNSTSSGSSKGKAIINHQADGNDVHLFVRKYRKSVGGKGAPFYYCGKINYESHKGEKPMSVEWRLENSLNEALAQLFR